MITTIKAATELDAEEAQDKQFVEAMGTEDGKKMQELEAACVQSRQTNLFVIDPKMSYPPEAWVKADPDFGRQEKSRWSNRNQLELDESAPGSPKRTWAE